MQAVMVVEVGAKSFEDVNRVFHSTRALLSLQMALDRITHSLRSPLGVAKGVVADISAGYPFDSKDIDFAMKAIDQLSSLLRQFNSMSTPLGIIAGKSSSIANLRARLRRAAADRAVVVQESSKAGLGSLMISEAFATSAEEVIRYIITKLPRNKHERKLELSLGITKNGNLGIRITGDTMQAQPIGNVNLLPDIYDAVAGDSSPEVLGLLFSAEVLAANGGALQLIAEGDSVRVALEMPILESDNARIGD